MTKKNRWKINWTSDKIMSTSALFISVISLIALLYQSYLAREENKLNQLQQSASVLPHLNQWYSDIDGAYKIIFGNKGVGPAFIKDVEISIDPNKIFKSSNAMFNHIFSNSPVLDTIPKITSDLVKGFVLPANETITIVEIDGQNHSEAFKREFSKQHIIFKVIYADIYGAEWLLTNAGDMNNMPILLENE